LQTPESEPPILRGEGGKFLPGTRPGPGAPTRLIKNHNAEALAKHARVEHAILAYDTLVKHMKRGSLRAAIEYLRCFTDLLATKDGAAAVNATAIKIVIGVDEEKL
jgi:hypothetical protein